jgi:hypothetical protein
MFYEDQTNSNLLGGCNPTRKMRKTNNQKQSHIRPGFPQNSRIPYILLPISYMINGYKWPMVMVKICQVLPDFPMECSWSSPQIRLLVERLQKLSSGSPHRIVDWEDSGPTNGCMDYIGLHWITWIYMDIHGWYSDNRLTMTERVWLC